MPASDLGPGAPMSPQQTTLPSRVTSRPSQVTFWASQVTFSASQVTVSASQVTFWLLPRLGDPQTSQVTFGPCLETLGTPSTPLKGP